MPDAAKCAACGRSDRPVKSYRFTDPLSQTGGHKFHYCEDDNDCYMAVVNLAAEWSQFRQNVRREEATRQAVRDEIEKAPYPCEGSPIWERHTIHLPDGQPDEDTRKGYEEVAQSLARAMLIVADDNPALLGKKNALWEAVKVRWPDLSDWLSVPSGGQFAWALHTVYWLHGRDAEYLA